MKQLVGLKCVVCQERIGSNLEGRFCSACDNAVHNKCCNTPIEAGACPGCGANLANAAALRAENDTKGHISASNASVLVGKVCPKCGHADYTRQRSQRWITFAHDRICTGCKTRYTPPTPIWAGILFVLVGFCLAGFFALDALFRFTSGNPLGIPALVFDLLIVVLGCLAIAHGLRCFINPGKV